MASQAPNRQMAALSAFDVNALPHGVSAAALVEGDVTLLKSRLSAIVNDVQSGNPKEAQRSLFELRTFFDAVVDQSGRAVQELFGQQVANNVLFVVLDSVVKPAFTQYCAFVGKRRLSRRGPSRGAAKSAGGVPSLTVAVAEAEMDAQTDTRAKRLRADVARPWRGLVDVLHQNLPAVLFRSNAASLAAAQEGSSAEEEAMRRARPRMEEWDGTESSMHGREDSTPRRWWASAPNHTALPLLWKNAVPFHTLCRHVLEVLQSDVLVPVAGQEYAQLLLQLCSCDGYLAAMQPGLLAELTARLVRLIEITMYEPNHLSSSGNSVEHVSGEAGNGNELENEEGEYGASSTYYSDATMELPRPTVEEGTVYASLLAELLRAPHMVPSFAPSHDAPAPQRRAQDTTWTVTLALQRLTHLATRRHSRPTSAFRLETQLLIALGRLTYAARHDYPLACAGPLELVRRLCHLFYATARRDGWRMEALAFMTRQLCISFASILGQCVRTDMTRQSGHVTTDTAARSKGEDVHHDKKNSGNKDVCMGPSREEDNHLSTVVPPSNLTLLHETVLPFALRLFSVTRSEFSLVARRELFHFPCQPLGPLFDFGAVVLYLACCTESAYVTLPASALTRKRERDEDRCTTALTTAATTLTRRKVTVTPDAQGASPVSSQPHTSPAASVLELFRSLFFLENTNASRSTPDGTHEIHESGHAMFSHSSSHVPSPGLGTSSEENNREGTRFASHTMANLNTNAATAAAAPLSAAAVQDLIPDGALLLLHLLAQPVASLALGESCCTEILTSGLLPLFPHYGVRLEGLLLAVLSAIAPRSAPECQVMIFRWLLRRHVPSPMAQREDAGQPREEVYQILTTLLEWQSHTTSQEWRLCVSAEERERLLGAAHYTALSARVRLSPIALLPMASTNATASAMALAMASNRAGLSFGLFESMLQFLAAYHHYGVTLTSTGGIRQGCLNHTSPCLKKTMQGDDHMHTEGAQPMTTDETGNSALTPVPTAMNLVTGVTFVVLTFAHGICFFTSKDDEINGLEGLGRAMLSAEEYLTSVSLILAAGELTLPHTATSCVSSNNNNNNNNNNNGCGSEATITDFSGSQSSAAQGRMRRRLRQVQRKRLANSKAPLSFVPGAVCSAAEGHWLLLPSFIHGAKSASDDASDCDSETDEPWRDTEGLPLRKENELLGESPLRRGDVPPAVLEALSSAVKSAVRILAERYRLVMVANDTHSDSAHSEAQSVLCTYVVQLLHLLLRLLRVGLWHLPPSTSYLNHNERESNGIRLEVEQEKDEEEEVESELNLVFGDVRNNTSRSVRESSPGYALYAATRWAMRLLTKRIHCDGLVHDHPLLRSLVALFDDVGSTILSRRFALHDPRQPALLFLTVISRRALEGGVVQLGPRRHREETANESIRLSCQLLSVIVPMAHESHVTRAAATTAFAPTSTPNTASPIVTEATLAFMDPSHVTRTLIRLLEVDGLIARNGTEAAPRLSPSLPTLLSVVDAVVSLLQALHEKCGDGDARRAVREVLTTLFARYRYGMAEGLFLAFGFYAADGHTGEGQIEQKDSLSDASMATGGVCHHSNQGHRTSSNSSTLCQGTSHSGSCNEHAQNTEGDKYSYDIHHSVHADCLNENAGQRTRLLDAHAIPRPRRPITAREPISPLLLEEGRLIDSFVDQLIDTSRGDMPTLTPQLQCAVLSGIYGILFRCESTVAEKLGKYLFSFLSSNAPYLVRCHTALHVRFLFSRFTHNARAVLQELLYRAREGISSMRPMLCATSLRALGEAARAVPAMEADVMVTLLECWATRGCAHRGRITECLDFIAGASINAKGLCMYYSERILFDWIWRLGHPIEAFPVGFLGFSTVADLCREMRPILLPLALLCSARPATTSTSDGDDMDIGYVCPNEFLWRLVTIGRESTEGKSSAHKGDAASSALPSSSSSSSSSLRDTKVLVKCLVVHFADVVAPLLAFSTVSPNEHPSLAHAARAGLEWIRSTFAAYCSSGASSMQKGDKDNQDEVESADFVALLHLYADGIMCRLVDLVGRFAPLISPVQVRPAITKFCQLAKTSMDELFASDAGDHVYVLLHHVYLLITRGTHRGGRRILLMELLERMIRQWWSPFVLRVSHTARCVLRLCGNMLLTCPDYRSRVCDVLLYAWTVTTLPLQQSPKSALTPGPQPVQFDAADEAFLSTILLALSEESRAIGSTWRAICRANPSLQKRDWQLQHSQLTTNTHSESNTMRHSFSNNESNITNRDPLDVVIEDRGEDDKTLERLLPLLRSISLVAGAPTAATSYCADLANAVDASRGLLARVIRENREGHVNTFARALRYVFAIVTAESDLNSGNSGAGLAREARLGAFSLLRALCWCFIEAGEGRRVESLLSATGVAELAIQRRPMSTVWRTLYRNLAVRLYKLSFDSDALLAQSVVITLREWLCMGNGLELFSHPKQRRRHASDTSDETERNEEREDEDERKRGSEGRGNVKECGGIMAKNDTMRKSIHVNEETKDGHGNKEDGNDAVDDEQDEEEDEEDNEVEEMEGNEWHLDQKDLKPFCRNPLGLSFHYRSSTPPLDVTVASVASLCDESVWNALRSGEERLFLRRFLVGLVRQYGLHHRFATVAAVLSHLLLRPLDTDADGGHRRLAFCESFLPLVLLHAMLSRETHTQRSQRVEWCESLEGNLFARASLFPHTTRLFLRALNVCRAARISSCRGRGLRPDGGTPQPLLRRPCALNGKGPFTFPVFPRDRQLEPAELTDVRESYWLSDLNPLVLANAAIACEEPSLALLFVELAGESLLGRRKGIPPVQPPPSTYSALFPSAQRSASGEGGGGVYDGTNLRSKTAEAERAQKLLLFRTAVHAVCVDAETIRRRRDGDHDDDEDDHGDANGDGGHRIDGAGREMRTSSPWEEAFLLRHPTRRMERERQRGNWRAVLTLLDHLKSSSTTSLTHGIAPKEQHIVPNTSHTMNNHMSRTTSLLTGTTGDADVPIKEEVACDPLVEGENFTDAQIAVERAHALLQLGSTESALEVLLSALRRNSESTHTLPWSPMMETQRGTLRAALSAALWRCGRWEEESLRVVRSSTAAFHTARVSVDEGLLFALHGIRRGEWHEVRRWTALAQRRLARELDATNWLRTILQAEALHDVSSCADWMTKQAHTSAPSPAALLSLAISKPPHWVTSKLAAVHVPYRELEMLDSVRQRLCVVRQEPRWWLMHLEHSSHRALGAGRPLLLRRWLAAQEEITQNVHTNYANQIKDRRVHTEEECFQRFVSTQGLSATALLTLLHARTEFASGNPHGAIAILQDITPGTLHTSITPKEAAAMPVIVHQLVEWASEARLVSLSQLVRDPFMSACVTADRSGACSLQLARLCHTLARDIANRLRSPEGRALFESVEESRRTRTELERQRREGGRSEAEDKILVRRIRTIQLDTSREDQEWVRGVESYALYRRSALNAYARFLQLSGTDGGANDTLAIFGFVSLWLQQDAQLDERTVFRDNRGTDGAVSATTKVMRKAIDKTPLHKFLPLFSQLAAQLGTSMDDPNLEDLVSRIALHSPLHAIWPLLALAKGHVFGPSAAIGAMHTVDQRKVTLARRIVHLMKSPPKQNISHSVSDTKHAEWRSQIVSQAERLSAAYVELAFHPTRDVTTRPLHRIPSDFRILEDIRNLHIPPPTLTLPITSQSGVQLPTIVRYEKNFTTPGGINVPKVLRCVLSNGRVVRQLLKSEDDLRQDSLIEQVFCLANELLAKERTTRRLHLVTYNVVPLAPTVGVIEWADGTIPFGYYLTGMSDKWPIGAHARYFPGEPTTQECRRQLREAGRAEKHDTLLAIYTAFSPAMHYFFLEHFLTPQEWLEKRDAYTRSVAAASMVGYIVGLGDRHGNNLLIHTERAELVHIDLGFAFDQAKILPVPELVPFRLTRNVVDGLGVHGADGPLRRHCEGTLRVMRERRPLLLTILESCAHDPLARWAVTVAPHPKDGLNEKEQRGDGGNAAMRQCGAGWKRGKVSYAEAERTLARVAEKIQGYEDGELLSVPTHVQKLLQAAQNTELLACMFDGWSPWL